MGQSVSYYYLVSGSYPGNHIRAEVIQVDNGPNHVNISVNLQTDSTLINRSQSNFGGKPWSISGYTGDRATRLFSYSGTASQISSPAGTWTPIVNQWCATVSRSGSFVVVTDIMYQDDDSQANWYFSLNQSIPFKAYVPDDVADTMTVSAATLGTAKTFTLTNGGNYAAHTDTLKYSVGTASGTISNSISVAKGGTGTVSWTPPASLGAQFPNDMSATCTLTLETRNSSNTLIGSRTYSITLNVPSYSYSVSEIGVATVSKSNYTTIGGTSYVAGKHKAKFAVPAPVTAKYGATLIETFKVWHQDGTTYQTTPITAATNVEYTSPKAGRLYGSIIVTDSRLKNQSGTTATESPVYVTYVANPGVTLTFTAERSGSTTTVNLSGTGTYGSSITNNAASMKFMKGSSQIGSATSGSNGTITKTAAQTQATASAATYTAVVTDSLGNTVSKTITVPIAFAYMQVGTCAGKGVAIGRYGTTGGTEDKMEVGMPVEIGDPSGAYMIRLGPVSVNNVTTWEFSVLQNGKKVCSLNPLQGLNMWMSNGTTKTLELSNSLLSIKTTAGVERINLNPTDGLTFKDATGAMTMNYPAVDVTEPYWRVTTTGYRLRNDSTGSGTILVNSVPTGDYPYLASDNGWTQIEYSSSVTGWIAEASGQLIYK